MVARDWSDHSGSLAKSPLFVSVITHPSTPSSSRGEGRSGSRFRVRSHEPNGLEVDARKSAAMAIRSMNGLLVISKTQNGGFPDGGDFPLELGSPRGSSLWPAHKRGGLFRDWRALATRSALRTRTGGSGGPRTNHARESCVAVSPDHRASSVSERLSSAPAVASR